MSSNGRLVGSPSRRNAEQFPEARLVRITRGGAAIGVNPVGMLDPQIVVNLLLELGVGVDLVIHGNWLGERFKCGARWFPQRARWNRRRVLAPCARATAKLGHSKRRYACAGGVRDAGPTR
jgi:hypothetical protein